MRSSSSDEGDELDQFMTGPTIHTVHSVADLPADPDAGDLAEVEYVQAEAPESEPEDNAAPAVHPMLEECKRLGEELARYNVAWGFNILINAGEMRPEVFAEAAGNILVQKGICSAEEWDTMVFSILYTRMNMILAAVKAQHRSGIVLPNGSTDAPGQIAGLRSVSQNGRSARKIRD